jgi:hypothetical protein
VPVWFVMRQLLKSGTRGNRRRMARSSTCRRGIGSAVSSVSGTVRRHHHFLLVADALPRCRRVHRIEGGFSRCTNHPRKRFTHLGLVSLLVAAAPTR